MEKISPMLRGVQQFFQKCAEGVKSAAKKKSHTRRSQDAGMELADGGGDQGVKRGYVQNPPNCKVL
ncbi:MAG: hypothetical protein QNJ72_31910 [Pleurocapsa sp. MO_226.B13]|nr:hypothetical protein [Pleurocapsa sp. MO_226.B13]